MDKFVSRQIDKKKSKQFRVHVVTHKEIKIKAAEADMLIVDFIDLLWEESNRSK